MLTTRVLDRAEFDAALDEIAQLRITVFRDWPYLYDGSLAYERDYLSVYRDSAYSVVVGAFDGSRLVGVSTGTPMQDHSDDFGAAFEGQDIALEQMFYCAESVLLPQYRGHGLGHKFFDHREAHARSLGFKKICFCAVLRPENHPLRPKDYRPLDAFWRGRGYRSMDGVQASFNWKDVDQSQETEKRLQFWARSLLGCV